LPAPEEQPNTAFLLVVPDDGIAIQKPQLVCMHFFYSQLPEAHGQLLWQGIGKSLDLLKVEHHSSAECPGEWGTPLTE